MPSLLHCIGLLLIVMVAAEMVCRFTPLGVPWESDMLGRRKSLHASASRSTQRIICLGDSLTFGMRVREVESYPSEVGRLLKPTNRFHVFNAGISGHTSVQILERVERDTLAFEPDFVVLWAGINDGMLKRHPDPQFGNRPFDKAPLATMSALLTTLDALGPVMYLSSILGRQNADGSSLSPRVDIKTFSVTYERLLVKLHTSGAYIIALKIPTVPDHFMHASQATVNLQRETYTKYNTIISDRCRKNNVNLISPQKLLDEDCYLNDGLHLNKKGNRRIAQAVYDRIFACNLLTLHQNAEQRHACAQRRLSQWCKSLKKTGGLKNNGRL